MSVEHRPGDVVRRFDGGPELAVLGRDMAPGRLHLLAADGALDTAQAHSLKAVSPHPIWTAKVRACTRRDHPDAPPEATTCPACGLSITAIEKETA